MSRSLASRGTAVGLTLLLGALPVMAGSVMLEWDAVEGADGYRVYYGTASGSYTRTRDAGPATSVNIDDISDCTDWYMAVKAYNSAGESAEFSNEVFGWARPRLTTPSPAAVMQGARITLDINGANFQSGATVSVDNPNVHLDSARTVSCNQVEVALTVEPTAQGVAPAEVGTFTLTVENPDRVYGIRADALEIQVNPARFLAEPPLR